ncbi:uncharacterized protein LOC107041870 [Diachasma alloeum]|uniref:uncharacterized protein LOC107041870 n=1 Tax=Diachasma alloeum TaxID=454923 RepID=UPI0007383EED|nr:uncharacterized protein LOC107041870 [Diachasma alloeum]
MPLSEIMEFKRTCRIIGYIKTNFAVVVHQRNSANNTCYGCIADNRLKLPIRIKNFATNFSSPFNIGDHEIIGKLQTIAMSPYFDVTKIEDIREIDEQIMSRKELRNANNDVNISSTLPRDVLAESSRKRQKMSHPTESSPESKKK